MDNTFTLSGMHCQSCVQKLTKAFQAMKGVLTAHVTLNPPVVYIESDRAITADSLNEVARAAGNYSVMPRTTTTTMPEPEVIVGDGIKKPSIYPLVLIVG